MRDTPIAALGAASLAVPAVAAAPATAQDATPAAASCESVGAMAGTGTPMTGHRMMEGTGTPTAGPGVAAGEAEVDRLYIDMTIPHHGRIVALAEAARPRLGDERPIAIAESSASSRPSGPRWRNCATTASGSPAAPRGCQ